MNFYRIILLLATSILAACSTKEDNTVVTLPDDVLALSNDKVAVAIGPNGALASLRNMVTGQEYASG